MPWIHSGDTDPNGDPLMLAAVSGAALGCVDRAGFGTRDH